MDLADFVRARIDEDDTLTPDLRRRRLDTIDIVEAWSAQRRPDQLDAGDELLRWVALQWRDHPDYREEWRP